MDVLSTPDPQSIRVFVGTDRSQQLAFKVLEYSIRTTTSRTVEIFPLIDIQVPEPKLKKNRQRTGFSFSRFCIPKMTGFKGRAIYLDADMLVLSDIDDLWNLELDEYCVLVQDDPEPHVAGVGSKFPFPARKKQCSVMVLSCDRLSWEIDQIVSDLDSGKYTYEQLMYELCVLEEHQIGYAVPQYWNSLEHYDDETRLIHFTDMQTQPWVSPWNKHGNIWINQLSMMINSDRRILRLVKDEIRAGHVRPSLRIELALRKIKNPKQQRYLRAICWAYDRLHGYVPHKSLRQRRYVS